MHRMLRFARHSRENGNPGLLLQAILICALIFTTFQEAKALTVREYCQLTLQILQTSVDEWNERLVVLSQFTDNRASYLSGLETVSKKYEAVRAQVYGKYGTSYRGYLAFMRENDEKVGSYLKNNQQVRVSIETLSTQIESLIGRYESMVAGK